MVARGLSANQIQRALIGTPFAIRRQRLLSVVRWARGDLERQRAQSILSPNKRPLVRDLPTYPGNLSRRHATILRVTLTGSEGEPVGERYVTVLSDRVLTNREAIETYDDLFATGYEGPGIEETDVTVEARYVRRDWKRQ